MDDYKRSHVPAFGSWDCHGDLPFTQCFESARQAGLLRYSYSEDRDLYVAGDLYQNDVMTPAMIVVPRRTARNCYKNEKEGKKQEQEQEQQGWVCECDLKEEGQLSPNPQRPTPKAVDEDLYKISPTLLRNTRSKRKRVMGFFSSCLLPTCVL